MNSQKRILLFIAVILLFSNTACSYNYKEQQEAIQNSEPAVSTLSMYLFDTQELFKIYARPIYLFGINSRCKNKQEAFNYIKILLSEQYQSDNAFFGLQVNIKAYEKMKDFFLIMTQVRIKE